MPDYAGQDALLADAIFLGRIKQSTVKSAIAIQNEATTVQNHSDRASLAYRVLHDPNQFAPLFCRGVISDGVTGSSSTDAAIDTRVAAVWDAYTKASI